MNTPYWKQTHVLYYTRMAHNQLGALNLEHVIRKPLAFTVTM